LAQLLNRTLLWDRLEHSISHARRYGHRLALLFLDLNNDTFGHAAGDLAIRLAADRLKSLVRGTDTVIGSTVLRDVARRLQLRMGLNDSLTEQLCFEAECEAAQTPAVRKALEEVLTQRHGDLRSVGETRTAKGTTLLSAIAAFESPDLRSDIEAVLSAADAWNVVNVSWRRKWALRAKVELSAPHKLPSTHGFARRSNPRVSISPGRRTCVP
jgi:hypothetical protein